MDGSSRYPKNTGVNFRKLDRDALIRVARHYAIPLKRDVTQADLVGIVTRKFENTVIVMDNDVVDRFSSQFCRSTADSSERKRMRYSRELLDSEPAKQGEQVAAKGSKEDTESAWILGNIVDFDGTIYEVQDEDEVAKTVKLPFSDVKRLEDTASHLKRGDIVLAVFPDTTSFYKATVVKNPKPPTHSNGSWEVIVRFEDDEDDTGKAPARRVPARFVLRIDDIEERNPEK